MTGSNRFEVITQDVASGDGRTLARSILGTTDAAEIFDRIRAFCAAGGLPSVSRVFLCEISVGAAFGLELEDGSPVVLKAHPVERNPRFLEAVYRVQRHVFEKGFPSPRPILGPAPFGEGYAVVEEFADRGVRADAHHPEIRRLMARALARLIRLASEVPNTEDLRLDWTWPKDRLWPRPHNALFDFEKTASGAEWIDAIAVPAKRGVDASAGPVVVGHADWSVKHFRFECGEVGVVYDWDSLRLDREAVIVGTAAATFPATWYLEVGSRTPSPEEMRLFLAEYEEARGTPFSAAEREAVVLAAVYVMSYSARCEHAVDPEGDNIPSGFRAALSGRHDEYLRLAVEGG